MSDGAIAAMFIGVMLFSSIIIVSTVIALLESHWEKFKVRSGDSRIPEYLMMPGQKWLQSHTWDRR